MKMRDAFTYWTPTRMESWATAGRVAIRERISPGADRLCTDFFMSGGAACAHVANETDFAKSSRWAFIEFVTMVVRDGIDPQVAHTALLDIDEYAESISLDTPGAREGDLIESDE